MSVVVLIVAVIMLATGAVDSVTPVIMLVAGGLFLFLSIALLVVGCTTSHDAYEDMDDEEAAGTQWNRNQY